MPYMIPSLPLPVASPSVPEAPVSAHGEAESIASLAKRVSAYLARVVSALADFEDQLLQEDGFFAREEHFEAQIENLRREFDQNKRAQILFARADAVGMLLAQLVAMPTASTTGTDLHSRRQQQFVFAASVLLTSSTSMTTLRANASLVERLWAYVERPAPLDPVQLQCKLHDLMLHQTLLLPPRHHVLRRHVWRPVDSTVTSDRNVAGPCPCHVIADWCRVAECLLFAPPSVSDSTPNQPCLSLVRLAQVLPRLLVHAYSEAVCRLLRSVLGLPICSAGGSAQSSSGSPGCVIGSTSLLPMTTVLAGEHSVLMHCVKCILKSEEASENCAELLCSLCNTLPDRPDGIELIRVFVQSLTPALSLLLGAVFGTALQLPQGATMPQLPPSNGAAGTRAVLAALQVTCAALKMEHHCANLIDEQDAWLPSTLLQSEGENQPHGRAGLWRPFARLLAPHLAALKDRLLHSRSLIQLQLAELLSTVIDVAPPWMQEVPPPLILTPRLVISPHASLTPLTPSCHSSHVPSVYPRCQAHGDGNSAVPQHR